MYFNSHSRLEGQHAFLSASKGSWVNYDDDKLAMSYANHLASVRGTQLHAFAHEAIRLGIKLGPEPTTLNMYVADGIGYNMTCEATLYHSDNAFGSPDTICFRQGKLRIHDLKTGVTPTTFTQLEIYAALFCLEYKFSPFNIEIELRIYQNDEVKVLEPDPDRIMKIMDKMVHFDGIIQEAKLEAYS